MRANRLLKRSALAAAVLGGAMAVAALLYPAAAAIACPGCYGFDPIGGNVFIDHAADASTRDATMATITAARTRVGGFYGRLASDPKILVCTSPKCYRRIGGGGSRGMALLDRALFLSPKGATPVIAAHELAHIELHRRIGLVATLRRDVPQWFDEGLAVTISDDPRYLAPGPTGDRCLVRSDEPLPTDRTSWIETAGSRDLYAKAACRVSTWLAGHGGRAAAVHLASGIAAGTRFADLYDTPAGR